MHAKHLGDSYDLVKRFFSQILDPIGSLYALEKFVPKPIHSKYTAVTSIPILTSRPDVEFGILLDPNTGIPLPDAAAQGATAKHASLPFIVRIFEEWHPQYLICFDQSYHRKHKLNKKQQRQTKMAFLQVQGLSAFYYVSHAPFLFISQTSAGLATIRSRLIAAGIPETLLEPRAV